MKNDLFSIGPLTIHSYGLMIALGILVCVFMGMYRARKYGYKDEAVLDIAIFGILSGFIGAKLLYVLVEFDRFLENPMDVLGSEGFVVYGGIIVGALAGVLYCRIKKLPCWEYFDLLALPLLWHRALDELAVSLQAAVTEDRQMPFGV